MPKLFEKNQKRLRKWVFFRWNNRWFKFKWKICFWDDQQICVIISIISLTPRAKTGGKNDVLELHKIFWRKRYCSNQRKLYFGQVLQISWKPKFFQSSLYSCVYLFFLSRFWLVNTIFFLLDDLKLCLLDGI